MDIYVDEMVIKTFIFGRFCMFLLFGFKGDRIEETMKEAGRPQAIKELIEGSFPHTKPSKSVKNNRFRWFLMFFYVFLMV